MWGTLSVLLVPIESRLNISRTQSSLAATLVIVTSASLAPVVGVAVRLVSLRWLMILGAVLSAAGYGLLASARSLPMYYLAYAALVGPGHCLCAVILPSALVTRWFTVGRGKALAFVHLPLLIVIMPLTVAFVLRRYGLPGAYGLLASLMMALAVILLWVVDYPPGAATASEPAQALDRREPATWPMKTLMGRGAFWIFTLALAALVSGQAMLSTHVVAIAGQWGLPTSQAAALLSAGAVGGMIGTLFFGWLGDKIGGRWTLLILTLDSAVLWGGLASSPPPLLSAGLVVMTGFHGAAAMPLFGLAISEYFGRANFERAFGLSNLVCLPFLVVAVPLASEIFVLTGSYRDALLVHFAFCAVTVVPLLFIRGRKA